MESETPEQPGTGAQPAAASRPATGSNPATPPPVEERLEGQRAWIAQLDRRLGVRSYAGAAAIVLALAAGIVGVVLALSAKDESATKAEVRSLRDQIETVQKEAADAAKQDVASLTDRIEALEGRVNTIAADQRTAESELKVVQDDIEELRGQISDLNSSPAGGSAGSGTNR